MPSAFVKSLTVGERSGTSVGKVLEEECSVVKGLLGVEKQHQAMRKHPAFPL